MANPMVSYLMMEFFTTLKRPSRVLRVLSKRRLMASMLQKRIGNTWISDDSDQGFSKRIYPTYADYIQHQKSKLPTLDLSTYDVKFRQVLGERLQELDFITKGTSVLCLAARIGTEVQAFMDSGCFAVGLDLNPGKDNKYVLYGDFHDLQFPDQSAEVVFTNSLDHVLYPERLISEVERVLKPGGYFIVEAMMAEPRYYESFTWSSTDDLVTLFQSMSLGLVRRASFEYPWKGEQLCLRKPDG